MSRYYWEDTLEPVLGEGIEAEEDIQQLGRKLGKLAGEGRAMPLVEMDGFVAGLQVLPEVVPAREWLVHVWGVETAFADIEEAAELEAAVRGHYCDVGRTLEEDAERYEPLLESDERTGGVVWKPWIVGFASAMRIRPGAWALFEASDDLEVQESVQVTQKLYEAANGIDNLGQMGRELLDDVAPMLIVTLVRDLNAAGKSGVGDAGEPSFPDTMH